MVINAFNSSTWEGETGGSLRCRPAWSTEQVSEQPSLGSKRNHRRRRACEDVIEQGALFQPQQAADLGSFSCMALVLESRMELPSVNKEARGMSWVSLHGALRGHCMKL